MTGVPRKGEKWRLAGKGLSGSALVCGSFGLLWGLPVVPQGKPRGRNAAVAG